MAELSREGHRSRMRKLYLSGGMENTHDHNLLELFLTGIIARKDVKPLSYALINKFGSLEGVFNASPEDLMTVDGVGEAVAVHICLIKDITKRIEINKNSKIKKITSTNSAFEYCKNILGKEETEKLLLINLENDGKIINHYIVGSGTVNTTCADIRLIVENVIKDKAASVIIAHNHPGGSAAASAQDINFTLELRNTLNKISVSLIDHIIVGEDSCEALRNNPRYSLHI